MTFKTKGRLVSICVVVIAIFLFSVLLTPSRPTEEDMASSAMAEYESEAEEHMEEQQHDYEIDRLNDISISYEEAYMHVGETTTVDGPVADISILNDSSGSPSFIDLGEAYPSTERFTVVVWEEHYDDVAAVLSNISRNDIIYVEGCIEMYDGIPQIEVTDPSQITIL